MHGGRALSNKKLTRVSSLHFVTRPVIEYTLAVKGLGHHQFEKHELASAGSFTVNERNKPHGENFAGKTD